VNLSTVCLLGCLCCWRRLWYKRGLSGKEKTAHQLDYLHVIPARLETHPRAFNPKFQTLDLTLDLLNAQLGSGEAVIDGQYTYISIWLMCFWYILNPFFCNFLLSVLWRCWLGGRKGIRPVKNIRVVGCWRGCLSGTRCRLALWPSWCHCHPLSLASVKSRLVFTFLVLAHLGSPGQRAVKRGCVCVYFYNLWFVLIMACHRQLCRWWMHHMVFWMHIFAVSLAVLMFVYIHVCQCLVFFCTCCFL